MRNAILGFARSGHMVLNKLCCDFQNKGKLGWTGTSFFVLEVPLCNLRPSIIYSAPCDRIVQGAYSARGLFCKGLFFQIVVFHSITLSPVPFFLSREVTLRCVTERERVRTRPSIAENSFLQIVAWVLRECFHLCENLFDN